MGRQLVAMGCLVMVLAASPAGAYEIAYWHVNDTTNIGQTMWRINPLGVVGAETRY